MRSDWEPPAFTRIRRRQRGVVSRRQCLAHFSRRQIDHRLDAHRWHALGRGVYLTRPLAEDGLSAGELEWFALLTARADLDRSVCLGGLTALKAWGLRRVEPNTVDVIVAPERRVALPRAATVRHTLGILFDEDLRLTLPPKTLPAPSLVDAVEWARSDKEATFIVAASFQQGLVSLAEVKRAAVPGSPRYRLLIATATDCAGGSHTLGELDFLGMCRTFRLPLPTRRQVRVVDAEGRLRFFDAVYDEHRLAVEIDGVQHDELGQQWIDADKEEALEILGYRLLRLPNVMLRVVPEKAARRLRRLLGL